MTAWTIASKPAARYELLNHALGIVTRFHFVFERGSASLCEQSPECHAFAAPGSIFCFVVPARYPRCLNSFDHRSGPASSLEHHNEVIYATPPPRPRSPWATQRDQFRPSTLTHSFDQLDSFWPIFRFLPSLSTGCPYRTQLRSHPDRRRSHRAPIRRCPLCLVLQIEERPAAGLDL